MVTDNNQDRPSITRNFDTGGGRGGGQGGYQTMGNPRGSGGNGVGGGLGRIIAVGLVVILICCVFTYYLVGNLDAKYQALPASVETAVNSLNTAVAGIPDSITTQVNSAVSTYESRLHNLEINSGGYVSSTQLNQALTDIANLTSQVGTLQGALTNAQNQITILQGVIDNSDIQHNSISISGGGLSVGLVLDSASTIGSGFATCNITVQITNNKDITVTLKELILNIVPHLQNSNLPVSPSWLTSAAVGLTYMSAYGTSTMTVVGGNYTVDINNMALVLNANTSATITFMYRFDYGADSSETLVNVQTFISNLIITPIITMADYVLGS